MKYGVVSGMALARPADIYVIVLAISSVQEPCAHGQRTCPRTQVGLWKCGFPETLHLVVKAHHSFLRSRPFHGVVSLIGGIGMMIHHSATSLIIVGICTHLWAVTRPITAACVLPILQHLCVLLKYHNYYIYLGVELLLEVYFQFEVLSNLGEFESNFNFNVTRVARGAALTMLLSHYFYLVSGVLELAIKTCVVEKRDMSATLSAMSHPSPPTIEGQLNHFSRSSSRWDSLAEETINAMQRAVNEFKDVSSHLPAKTRRMAIAEEETIPMRSSFHEVMTNHLSLMAPHHPRGSFGGKHSHAPPGQDAPASSSC